MEVRPAWSFGQAVSQTPVAAVEKPMTLGLAQKHDVYRAGSASLTAGGTQPPLASYRGTHATAHEGSALMSLKGGIVVVGGPMSPRFDERVSSDDRVTRAQSERDKAVLM